MPEATAGFVIGFSFSVLLAIILRVFRCPHTWESVDKIEVPSRLDNMKAAGVRIDIMSMWGNEDLAVRKVVLAIGCRKCGACKLIKEQSH